MVGPVEETKFSSTVLYFASGFCHVFSCENLKLTLTNAHFIWLNFLKETLELFRSMLSATLCFKDKKILK